MRMAISGGLWTGYFSLERSLELCEWATPGSAQAKKKKKANQMLNLIRKETENERKYHHTELRFCPHPLPGSIP